jgi:hypothetical protein
MEVLCFGVHRCTPVEARRTITSSRGSLSIASGRDSNLTWRRPDHHGNNPYDWPVILQKRPVDRRFPSSAPLTAFVDLTPQLK